MAHRLLIALTTTICTLVAAQVQADTRVTVHDFNGPNAGRVRDDVVNLLERQSGVTIISKGQIESSARKLGVDPESPEGRSAVARELQLSAWMSGVIKKRSGKLHLTVAVYDGAQHALVGRAWLSGRSLSKLSGEIREHLWRKSRRALSRAAAPDLSDADSGEAVAQKTRAKRAAKGAMLAPVVAGDAAVSDTALESDESGSELVASAAQPLADEGDEAPRRKGRGEALRAFLGVGTPYRNLSYSDRVTSSLGDFQLGGAPMLDVNVAFHPARPFTDGWASWIGLDLRAQLAGTTASFDRDGNKFKSDYNAYHLGLRARVPVGNHYLSAFSGYAMNRLEISPPKGVSAPTPSLDYRMIRSGLGTELALFDSFLLGVDGAFLHFLEVGEIASWFPRATAGGLELDVSATYNVTSGIFARAAVSYQRTFFDFNSKPGDAKAAGGATDQHLALSIGAGLSF